MSIGAKREVNVNKVNLSNGKEFSNVYNPNQKDYYELRGYTGANSHAAGMISHDESVKIRDQLSENLKNASSRL